MSPHFRAEEAAALERRALKQNVRKGPRGPVFVNGVRLGRLALWT